MLVLLIGMNELFSLEMTQREKEIIGGKLGADVVPCFYNQPVKAEGIGEMVTPIDTNLKFYLVMIKPSISCNTKEMYQKIEEQEIIKQQKNTQKMIQAFEKNQITEIANHLYNVFEEVIEEKQIIQEIKGKLIQEGALRKFNDRIWFLCLWHF